jgi:hypothetical protein
MGADGHLTLARIGDGQCYLHEDLPKIIVGEPVVLLFMRAFAIDRDSHGRIVTYSTPWLLPSNEHVSILQARISGGAAFVRDKFGLLWMPRKRFEDMHPSMREEGAQIGCVDYRAQCAEFDKMKPGLWVPTSYYACGVEDDEESWSVQLDKRCVVTDEVEFECWT